MDITITDIEPYLDAAIPSGKEPAVTAWLTAISAHLGRRYGAELDSRIAPAVHDIVGQAILRRLDRGRDGSSPTIKRQATGPSSVEYNTDLASLTGWFYPDQAAELDRLFQGATITSVRLLSPDTAAYPSTERNWDDDTGDE